MLIAMKWFKEEKLGLTYQLCWVSSHCLHLKSLFPLQKGPLQPVASPGCDHGDLPQVCGMSLPRVGCGELSAPYPITDSRATSAGATLQAAKVPPAVQRALGGSLKNIYFQIHQNKLLLAAWYLPCAQEKTPQFPK